MWGFRVCRAKCGAGLLLVSAAVWLLAGCQDQSAQIGAKLDAGFKNLLAPRKTPQQYMLVAVSSEDPDARRDAVAEISKSKLYEKEWAVKGFVAIALLESEPQTRCVAIRALGRTGDPRAVETALKILNYRDYPPQDVWPPVGLCRWDATIVLADMSAAGKIPEEYREPVYKTLLDRLRNDDERHARIAAARGLAYYPQDETVRALIAGLRDEDFAVAHQCEEALVQLTGQTHEANVLAWEEWLAANQEDAFAHTGETPESRRPPYRNGLEKSWYDTVELVRWLWPGSKEE
jgi:HEAT repeat protein